MVHEGGKTRKRVKKTRMRGGGCVPSRNIYYTDENDCPGDFCLENGKLAIVRSVEAAKPKKRIQNGSFLYAVLSSFPETVWYLPDGPLYDCTTGEYYTDALHTCVTQGEPVLCAGVIESDGRGTLVVNNWSGHYLPNRKSLFYVKCLLEELGYTVSMKYYNNDSGDALNYYGENNNVN